MERNFFTTAIVLKTRRFGDFHKIVSMLSPERGIIDAVLHGAYKGKSRLSSITDPFCISKFLIYHNPAKNTFKINGCELVFMNDRIKENLNAFYNASFFCEVILKTHASGADYAFSYKLLHYCLTELNNNKKKSLLITSFFLYNFLSNSGFIGDLLECSSCGKSLENQDCYYSNEDSCFFCSNCKSAKQKRLNSQVITFLSNSLAFKLEKSLKIGLDKDVELIIRNILLEIFIKNIDITLNTLEYLDYGLE